MVENGELRQRGKDEDKRHRWGPLSYHIPLPSISLAPTIYPVLA